MAGQSCAAAESCEQLLRGPFSPADPPGTVLDFREHSREQPTLAAPPSKAPMQAPNPPAATSPVLAPAPSPSLSAASSTALQPPTPSQLVEQPSQKAWRPATGTQHALRSSQPVRGDDVNAALPVPRPYSKPAKPQSQRTHNSTAAQQAQHDAAVGAAQCAQSDAPQDHSAQQGHTSRDSHVHARGCQAGRDAKPTAGPLFVPVVLRMDAKDQAMLLEEWCSQQQVRLLAPLGMHVCFHGHGFVDTCPSAQASASTPGMQTHAHMRAPYRRGRSSAGL